MRTPTQLRAAAMPLRAQRADDRAQPQEEEIVFLSHSAAAASQLWPWAPPLRAGRRIL